MSPTDNDAPLDDVDVGIGLRDKKFYSLDPGLSDFGFSCEVF